VRSAVTTSLVTRLAASAAFGITVVTTISGAGLRGKGVS
jgi:hypothetical protein